jgi:hypothetical protein
MEYKAQYHKALDAAGLNGKSGLYIIRPKMLGSRPLLKFGNTTNADARLHGSYLTAYPAAADSFELLGWLTVGDKFVRVRERRLFDSSIGYGFVKSKLDNEWFEYFGPDLMSDIFKLLRASRFSSDGNFYTFDPASGAMINKSWEWDFRKPATRDRPSTHPPRRRAGPTQSGPPRTLPHNRHGFPGENHTHLPICGISGISMVKRPSERPLQSR